MLSRAVKANPVANMDFILTRDRSRLSFFSFSSSRSSFFFWFLTRTSPCVSLSFSTGREGGFSILDWDDQGHVITFLALFLHLSLQLLVLFGAVDKDPSQAWNGGIKL